MYFMTNKTEINKMLSQNQFITVFTELHIAVLTRAKPYVYLYLFVKVSNYLALYIIVSQTLQRQYIIHMPCFNRTHTKPTNTYFTQTHRC